MLLDFVPEAIALGATFAFDPARGRLLVFQDIATAVPLENLRTPGLGAVAGFLLGLIGQMLAMG